MENNNYGAETISSPESSPSKAKSIVGMALTIVGMVLSWMGLCGGFPGFLSIVICIIGLLLAKVQPFKKVAKICGIVGIAVSAAATVAGFILVAVGIFQIFG